MSGKTSRANLAKPLLLGRSLRVVFGLACFVGIAFVPPGEFAWLGILGLVIAGASFLIGGLLANPGCEVTALLNLVLSSERRIHFP